MSVKVTWRFALDFTPPGRATIADTFPVARHFAALPWESDLSEDRTRDTSEILRRLLVLVTEHNLAELTVEDDGLTISVKGESEAVPPAPVIPVPIQAQAHLLPLGQIPAYSQTPVTAPSSPAHAGVVHSVNRVAVESPMVGVFYRSPSPEDPPFVNVGDVIHIGQTVGLIEAMKVYSELPSEVAGRLVEIAAENGKLVKQGQPLYYVEPV